MTDWKQISDEIAKERGTDEYCKRMSDLKKINEEDLPKKNTIVKQIK